MTKFKHPENVSLVKFQYMNHTVAMGGLLPTVMGAHACWHYIRCAMIHLGQVDRGAIYVGQDDPTWGLDKIIHATQLLYEIEDREEIFRHLKNARAEAERCGLPWDRRVENPVSEEYRSSLIIQPDQKFIDHIKRTKHKDDSDD